VLFQSHVYNQLHDIYYNHVDDLVNDIDDEHDKLDTHDLNNVHDIFRPEGPRRLL